MHACRDEDHSGIVDGKLFVSRSCAPPLLEPIDASLDHIALVVASFVERYSPYPVRTRGNDWLDAAPAQCGSQSRAVVAFVAGQAFWPQPRATATDALDLTGIDEPHELRRVMFLPSFRSRYARVSRLSSRSPATAPSIAAAGRRALLRAKLDPRTWREGLLWDASQSRARWGSGN
jgi:hypothetical protein